MIEADANKQNSTPMEDWNSSAIDPDDSAFGAAITVEPKFTSYPDPCSQWTAARVGPAFFSYSCSYLIDTDHGGIVDAKASRSILSAEVGASRTMLERVMARFDLKPERLIAGTAYGWGKNLGWLVQRGIAPHIPVASSCLHRPHPPSHQDVGTTGMSCPGAVQVYTEAFACWSRRRGAPGR